MKCSRCAAELPGQAQFCMRCGTPVTAARPGGAAMMTGSVGAASAGQGARKSLIAAGIALLVLACGALAYFALFAPGSRVVQAPGTTPLGGPLTERAGRISDAGPLTDKPGLVAPTPREPVEVIDYLKFLKEIERERVTLQRQQVSQALKQSAALTGGNIMGEMDDNPEVRHNQDYTNFQNVLAEMSQQWQQISQKFLSYPKPVPQSCAALRDKYYDLLGKTSAAVASVGNAFSKAMGGDPGGALDALTSQQGSGLGTPSREVADACVAANDELYAVRDKYNLKHDWDIKDDGGGPSLLGR